MAYLHLYLRHAVEREQCACEARVDAFESVIDAVPVRLAQTLTVAHLLSQRDVEVAAVKFFLYCVHCLAHRSGHGLLLLFYPQEFLLHALFVLAEVADIMQYGQQGEYDGCQDVDEGVIVGFQLSLGIGEHDLHE